MRICKDCKVQKSIDKFSRCGKSIRTGETIYRWRCKQCHNLKLRKNLEEKNAGRFKKGNTPWNRGKRRYTGNKGAKSVMFFEWRERVFKRDDYKCQECFTTTGLCPHHIKTWNDYPDLRFEIDNGITLCKSCHAKLHGRNKCNLLKNGTPWNKGIPCNEEVKCKIAAANKGKVGSSTTFKKGSLPWNAGKKTGIRPTNAFKKGHIPWNKKD